MRGKFDEKYAFNSTRCIRNQAKVVCIFAFLVSFNSTRCIRNLSAWAIGGRAIQESFNSTRCIRNLVDTSESQKIYEVLLSTPHGALGTYLLYPTTLSFPPFNSTRCIRNQHTGTKSSKYARLSTPHGALGTHPHSKELSHAVPFNSTRCIRNFDP